MISKAKNQLRHLVPKSAVARDVRTLVTGTSLAQAIPIAITPILTRLYNPDEFGLAALYLACVAVLSVIATGRYELAITLPASDQEAVNVVTFTLKLSVLISLSLFLPIIFFGPTLANWLGNPQLAPWLYLLPVSVLATTSFNVFQYWCNRKSQYRMMSTNRVQNSAFSSVFNVVFGLGKTPGGLILGPAIGQALAALLIGRKLWVQNIALSTSNTKQSEYNVAKRYVHHPKHIAPAQLLGVVAVQIPVFMIGSAYSLAILGFFSLAYRMVTLPSTLIASAIGDVYRQRISKAYSERGGFRLIYVNTLKTTMLVALPPFAVLYLSAPWLFEIIFGTDWRVAGEYAQILVVGAFFQFIFTPLDKGAVVVGASRYILAWHATRLAFFLLLFFAVTRSGMDIQSALWCFVIINSLLYVLDGFVELKLARK
jgi:O-antigen/teichoic acid export membrane protein